MSFAEIAIPEFHFPGEEVLDFFILIKIGIEKGLEAIKSLFSQQMEAAFDFIDETLGDFLSDSLILVAEICEACENFFGQLLNTESDPQPQRSPVSLLYYLTDDSLVPPSVALFLMLGEILG